MNKKIRDLLEQLQTAMAEQVEVREEAPRRTISRKSKNVQLGTMFDFPTFGWQMVTGFECLHGDDEGWNNVLGNLRWGTRSENMIEAWANGRRSR